jgi:chemotaxis protein methyltransferase CheR
MSADVSDRPVLTADELRRFCEFLYVRTGMQFGETKRYYIERRLFDRLEATGALSFANYLLLLRGDPAEAAIVINSFTVNETYFYREDHQLKCLSDNMLPEVIAKRGPGDKVRIWSQPCSTGEETYSIALWLLENWRMVDAYNVEIIGSDIDTDALEGAREAVYGERSLSRLPDTVVRDYFEPAGRARRRLITDLKESVAFTEANLIDRASMSAQGRFDVIFCRNVLIYFDDDSRARAAELLFESLNPGGFICLGHTESMSRISDKFLLRRFPDAIVYQRPAA